MRSIVANFSTKDDLVFILVHIRVTGCQGCGRGRDSRAAAVQCSTRTFYISTVFCDTPINLIRGRLQADDA